MRSAPQQLIACLGLLSVLCSCSTAQQRTEQVSPQPDSATISPQPDSLPVPASRPDPAPSATQPPPQQGQPIQVAPGVVAIPGEKLVEFAGRICLTAGWLEQIVCFRNSREHESLVVTDVAPSNIHTALLLAGFEAGHPGHWTRDEADEFTYVAPQGDRVDVLVRYELEGQRREHSVRQWIADADGVRAFPDEPWIFGGSAFRPNTASMGPGEHYVADMTGSIVGLVTFGDEVLGFVEVFADQAEVQPLEWEVARDAIPPIGTPVTIVIKRYESN